MSKFSYFKHAHQHCTQEEWRWLSDGEIMVEGDIYESGNPVGWRGKGFNGIGRRFCNGIDEDVIRRKSVDEGIKKPK
jgi:hypothetical protein